MSNYLTPVRLSPSGPLIGDPPVVSGNSSAFGRIWIASASGDWTNVPGTAVGDVCTLACDLKPSQSGYFYDLEADTMVVGTGGNWHVFVLGSTDGGSTYPYTLAQVGATPTQGPATAPSRLHSLLQITTSDNADINRVKMQLQRVNSPADSSLMYSPLLTTLRIIEVSPNT